VHDVTPMDVESAHHVSDTSLCYAGDLRAAADLQRWADHDWTGSVQLETLAGLERLAVRTRNSTYEITVLSPRTGEVLVQGGRFFPTTTRAQLAGASAGGSFLKVRTICPGFLMELLHDGRTIVTTRVQSVAPIPETAPAH
jgi:hypothetical protein